MSRKVPKLSVDHICVSDKPPNKSSTWQNHSPFTMLPTELLSLIFSYLSPRDLLNIQKLNIDRLTEISSTSSCADFSGCNAVSEEELLSFFIKDRTMRIQEINFNDVFYVKSSILERCITRCKHLRKLFVYECGLSFKNILNILCQCKELEELCWSFPNDQHLVIKQFTDKVIFCNLRKLYLTVTDSVIRFMGVCEKLSVLLDRCTCSVEVCVNFSPFFISTLPPSMGRRIFAINQIYISGKPFVPLDHNERTNEGVLNKANDQIKMIAVIEKQRKCEFEAPAYTFHSAYLQLVAEDDELNEMPSFPANSVHALVLIMTKGKVCLDNHMEKLKRVTGKKLRHLTVHEANKDSDVGEMAVLERNLYFDYLTEIVSTCVNLQVLNLSELHFEDSFPFTSLYCLWNLKVLNLSACSLSSLFSGTAIPLKQNFENLASYCKNVEVFSLYGCVHCQHGPTDEQMLPIAKWQKLTRLLISGVVTFRLCHFLLRIGESCPRFASLELCRIGNPHVCHFMPSVTRVLRMIKELKFLRLEQNGIQLDNPLFWKSVALCQTLQGLCLYTELVTPLSNKPFTDSIAKLPFLHLFHLNAQRFCSNLPQQIKSLLIRNGVKCMNIHTGIRNRTCALPHFPW